MAEEGLKIRVGADLSDLNKELKATENNLKDFGKSVGKNINTVGFDDFTQKVKAVKQPVANASNALLNFGRIAQDAPFGLIGITNNINPALESFQRLSKESGSTGKALKSLVAGLAGPAGIGIAVSVVSSVLTGLVLKYGSLSNAIVQLTSSYSSLQQAQRDLNKSFAESSASAQGQVSTANALFEIARDTALSTNARQQAIDKLNKDYPQYLGNLDLETIATDKVKDAQEKLNKSLINQAKIKGVQDLISEETKKQGKAYIELTDAIDGANTGFGKFLELLSSANPVTAGTGLSNLTKNVAGIGLEFDKTEAKVKAFETSLKKLLTEEAVGGNLDKTQQEAARKAAEAAAAAARKQAERAAIKAAEEAKKAAEAARARLEEALKIKAVEIPIVFKDTGGIESLDGYAAFRKKAQQGLDANPLLLGVKIDVQKSQPIDPSKVVGYTETKAELDKTAEAITAFSNEVSQTLNSGLVDAFSSVGDAIGQIVADGTKGLSAFAGVGEALGNILIYVGKAAIATGVGVEAILLALKNLKGPGAIAAGIALVALGTIIKSKLKNAPGLAQGGIIPAGYENDTFPARLSSREAVIPLDRLEGLFGGGGNGGTLTTRVSGNDLVFVLERTQRSQGRAFG